MDNNINDTQTVKTGFWESIKKALKYAFQSAQGKYSLETYLEVMGKFTDDEINQELNKGLKYVGGEVSFYALKSDKDIRAAVELKFFDVDGKKTILKKAERRLEKSIFVDEALDYIEEKGILTFEVSAPRRA